MHFKPITEIYGIPHSSYGLQLGIKDEFVALNIYWGKELQDMKTFIGIHPLEINTFEIKSYVLFKLLIPDINPREIDKVVRLLIDQLRKKLDVEDL